jgi:hypothetical protein
VSAKLECSLGRKGASSRVNVFRMSCSERASWAKFADDSVDRCIRLIAYNLKLWGFLASNIFPATPAPMTLNKWNTLF